MKILKPILALCIGVAPVVAHAQGLVPTMESEFEYCQERPVEPRWMSELPSRERHKRLVIQTIYRAQSLERVVEAQECTCQTRYPSWDTAIQHFNDNYLGGDRNALREAEEEHFDRFSELRAAARTLCEAEGYW
jgi:uncharacterized protein HemY